LRRADDQQQRAQGFLTRARWLRPVELRHVAFLRASTDRTIQITLRGPFTVSRQAKNEFYKDEEELVMDYAAAVNAEIREPKAAGADVIQLKEPRLQARRRGVARLGPAGDRLRPTRHPRADPRCTSTSATPMSPAISLTAPHSCRS
jgi:methionine synthase II (cobalamin-independent)